MPSWTNWMQRLRVFLMTPVPPHVERSPKSQIEHHGYTLIATPLLVEVDGAARWTTQCRIERHTGLGVRSARFDDAETSETENEAIERSLTFGKQIIEGKHPRLTPPRPVFIPMGSVSPRPPLMQGRPMVELTGSTKVLLAGLVAEILLCLYPPFASRISVGESVSYRSAHKFVLQADPLWTIDTGRLALYALLIAALTGIAVILLRTRE